MVKRKPEAFFVLVLLALALFSSALARAEPAIYLDLNTNGLVSPFCERRMTSENLNFFVCEEGGYKFFRGIHGGPTLRRLPQEVKKRLEHFTTVRPGDRALGKKGPNKWESYEVSGVFEDGFLRLANPGDPFRGASIRITKEENVILQDIEATELAKKKELCLGETKAKVLSVFKNEMVEVDLSGVPFFDKIQLVSAHDLQSCRVQGDPSQEQAGHASTQSWAPAN